MKRFLSVLLAVIMLLAVVAVAVSCGDEKDPVTDKPETQGTEKQTEASQTEKEPDTQGTEAPVTEPPATEPPATESSATEPPATEPPATETSDTESSATEPPATDTETQGNAVVIPTQYVDVDFGGKTFNVVYRYQTAEDTPSGWGQVFDLYEDTENPDDAMSAAAKLFKAYMGSTFNCEVVGVPAIQAGTVLSTSIEAGETKYDMGIYNTSPYGFANSGKYYNLLPMLDQSLTCWDTAVIRDLALGNKLYGITGNCSTSDDDYTWVMFFNKAILSENNIEYPYQLVKDGKWTIDKFLEYSRACAKDLDGDNTISNTEGKDIFGFVTHGEHSPAVWIGCGVRMAGPVQADGKIKTSCFALGYEADVYQKTIDVLWDSATGYANKQANMGVPEGLRTVFTSGRAAFYAEVLQNIGNSYQSGCLKDVEGLSFGVIPQPKWDEEQSSYYHYVNTQASFIGIPITTNYAISSTFINVYGLVFEQIVQAKFISNVATAWVSDPDVADMMTLIFNSRVWDAGYWLDQASVHSMLLSDVGTQKNRYAKRVPSGETKLQANLDSYYDKVMSLTV